MFVCKHKCIYILAYTALKTPLRRVHPNSGNTRRRCVCSALYLQGLKSLPSLQRYTGNIFYIMLVVYIQTWFRTRCLSWRTSCKFVHRFNGRVTFLMWHSCRFSINLPSSSHRICLISNLTWIRFHQWWIIDISQSGSHIWLKFQVVGRSGKLYGERKSKKQNNQR